MDSLRNGLLVSLCTPDGKRWTTKQSVSLPHLCFIAAAQQMHPAALCIAVIRNICQPMHYLAVIKVSAEVWRPSIRVNWSYPWGLWFCISGPTEWACWLWIQSQNGVKLVNTAKFTQTDTYILPNINALKWLFSVMASEMLPYWGWFGKRKKHSLLKKSSLGNRWHLIMQWIN